MAVHGRLHTLNGLLSMSDVGPEAFFLKGCDRRLKTRVLSEFFTHEMHDGIAN